MDSSSNQQDWLDQVQSGPVSPELADRLRRDLRIRPAEAARLEDELLLNAALEALPPVHVSSNFTARVMSEIERADTAREPTSSRWWPLRVELRWLGAATSAALLALVVGGWWQARVHQRQTMAASVSAVSGVAAMPEVEWLQDFDAIQLLRTPAQKDDVELIATLATP